jgi:hypothetical protein
VVAAWWPWPSTPPVVTPDLVITTGALPSSLLPATTKLLALPAGYTVKPPVRRKTNTSKAIYLDIVGTVADVEVWKGAVVVVDGKVV